MCPAIAKDKTELILYRVAKKVSHFFIIKHLNQFA